GLERLVGTAPDLPGTVPLAGADPVVAFDDEAVVESFGCEVALFLGDPFLQAAVRHDPQRHRQPPVPSLTRVMLQTPIRTEGHAMTEPTRQGPSRQAVPHELPAALREAGLTNWVREPLDDAVDRRRRILFPPAAATMGTPASESQ